MPSDAAPFAHSVASFDPTTEGVLIWTRTESGPSVEWVVARDPDLADVVASGTATPDADADHTVTVDVEGLEPATTYHYAFSVDGERSPVGRTRTLAAEGALDPARIVVVSCANLARAPLTVARAAAAVDDVDLVLHLGDYIYEDDGAKGDIPVDPPRYLVTADDYRRRYRQARADTDLQHLHERHPMVAIWDDHDVADNTWDDGAKAHDPEEHGPFPDRLAAANRVRQEFVPVRLPDPDDDRRLWRSLALGGLAEMVVLDTRLGGRDKQPDEGEDLDDPDRSMLSEPQWAWATERIADRTRPWLLLTSTVPVSIMELPMPDHGAKALDEALPDGYAVRDGVALCTDQWDGYRAERRRLVSALDGRGGGAVIVSADIHSSWVIDGPFTDDLRPVAGEVVGSSISSTTMGGNLGRAATALAERIADSMEHVRWCDIDEHGFLVVDVTQAAVEASAWAVDPDDRSATARRMATWSIGPEPGARWTEVTTSSGHDDREPDTIEGMPAAGPPAGGLQPPSHPLLGKLVRVGAGALALVLTRSVVRGVGRARARR